MMISLYVIATPDNLIVADMSDEYEDQSDDPFTFKLIFGAVNPATDGNYYNHLIISGQKEQQEYYSGAEGFLKYLREAIQVKNIIISDEFPFDPDTLRIVELRQI